MEKSIKTQADKLAAELMTLTVKQIKELAIKYGVKPCPGRKKTLACYVAGAIWEKTTGIDSTKKFNRTVLYKDITYKYIPQSDTWIKDLYEHGVAVVPIPDFDCDKYLSMFWNWIESTGNGVMRNNKNTHDVDKLPHTARGIFKSYIGHEPFMWEIREKVYPLFCKLWDTNDLLTTFDGASVNFAGGKTKSDRFNHWFHYDMDYEMYNKKQFAINGLIYLTDNGPDDGGFVYVENSHKHIKEYINTHPSYGHKFGYVDIQEKPFCNEKVVKLNVKKGHMVLFTTDVLHCNMYTDNNYRAVAYVSMLPKKQLNTKDLVTRKKMYENNRMTDNWHAYTGKKINMRFRSPQEPLPTTIIPYDKLSELRKKLIDGGGQ